MCIMSLVRASLFKDNKHVKNNFLATVKYGGCAGCELKIIQHLLVRIKIIFSYY